NVFGQSARTSHVPAILHTPVFLKKNSLQLGVYSNNYGTSYQGVGQVKNITFSLAFQHQIRLLIGDPLRLSDYPYSDTSAYLLQSRPSDMQYIELGLGYHFRFEGQHLNLLAGVGQRFRPSQRRAFVQLDWGCENRFVQAGISFRGSYTTVREINLFTLEPLTQVKVKLWRFRLVHQFGYAIPLKRGEKYMHPIFTVGIEYIWER
ncbi:MAG: hypothetical protein AAFR59_11755, partial [Bacteroidota bacterium]